MAQSNTKEYALEGHNAGKHPGNRHRTMENIGGWGWGRNMTVCIFPWHCDQHASVLLGNILSPLYAYRANLVTEWFCKLMSLDLAKSCTLAMYRCIHTGYDSKSSFCFKTPPSISSVEWTGTPASIAVLHMLRSSSHETTITLSPGGIAGSKFTGSPPEHLIMSAIWSLSGLRLGVRWTW